MKRYINRLASSLVALAAALGLILAFIPAAVHADAITDLCEGVNIGSSETCGSAASETRVSRVVTTAVNIFSIIVGLVAVIMIAVSALKFIISGGEASNINAARSTLLYAVVGLIVVALAQVLIRYVLFKTR